MGRTATPSRRGGRKVAPIRSTAKKKICEECGYKGGKHSQYCKTGHPSLIAAETEKAAFAEGDKVEIVHKNDPRAGQIGVVGQVDDSDQTVEVEFNDDHAQWFMFAQITKAPEDAEPSKLNTTVDGKDANVVLDGKTGAPTKSAQTGKQVALIEVPLQQLVHDYNELAKQRDQAASQRGFWGSKIKALDERINPILAEIRRRDDEENGVEPALFTAPAGDDEDDEEGAEE